MNILSATQKGVTAVQTKYVESYYSTDMMVIKSS
jgi:hypothetical protein